MPRGGARPGAGRPRKPKLPFTPKNVAVEVLSDPRISEKDLWLTLLADRKTRLQALMYLTDRRDGRAPQSIGIGGIGEDGQVVPNDTPLLNVTFVSSDFMQQLEEPRTIEAQVERPMPAPETAPGNEKDPALAKAKKEAAATAARKAQAAELPPLPEGFVYWPRWKIRQYKTNRLPIPPNVIEEP